MRFGRPSGRGRDDERLRGHLVRRALGRPPVVVAAAADAGLRLVQQVVQEVRHDAHARPTVVGGLAFRLGGVRAAGRVQRRRRRLRRRLGGGPSVRVPRAIRHAGGVRLAVEKPVQDPQPGPVAAAVGRAGGGGGGRRGRRGRRRLAPPQGHQRPEPVQVLDAAAVRRSSGDRGGAPGDAQRHGRAQDHRAPLRARRRSGRTVVAAVRRDVSPAPGRRQRARIAAHGYARAGGRVRVAASRRRRFAAARRDGL